MLRRRSSLLPFVPLADGGMQNVAVSTDPPRPSNLVAGAGLDPFIHFDPPGPKITAPLQFRGPLKSPDPDFWLPFPDYSTSSATPHPRTTALSIISWNIDFMAPFSKERMQSVLSHLTTLLPMSPKSTILLLQEVNLSSLQTLLAHPWVQANFLVTDNKALGRYFTLSLVSKDVPVSAVFRKRYELSHMERGVLVLDVPLQGGGVFRIANTHLESLPDPGVTIRPVQLAAVAKLLKEDGVVAGLVAGDMNCIRPEDEELATKCGLGDVWNVKKELAGGALDEHLGFTWGYQPRCRFPPGRLDRVFFCGDIEFEPVEGQTVLTRVGVGLRCREPESRGEQEDDRHMVWASDHYGIWVQAKAGDASPT
ncbi:Endonuclease/exonuclease/phosphatase [Sphaerosporella brunnea]|uniref:Endonuclease/exonuclease/phosphatase n=1 Tax=Sphaerosporella brunnea TaxID=1250544 RepID=A0A5J5EK96_9PEZI|nr:Endonuclease/exonuclease/phosphatase [Sphaerosporella brunnea]